MHNALRKIRHKQGLTQAEMADLLGVSRSCVAKWETGVREADIFTIRKYNELFNCKEEIVAAFKKMKNDKFYSLNISIFNDNGKAQILRLYNELKKNPKYLKNS